MVNREDLDSLLLPHCPDPVVLGPRRRTELVVRKYYESADTARRPLVRMTQFINALQKMVPSLARSLKQYFIKTGLIIFKRQPN